MKALSASGLPFLNAGKSKRCTAIFFARSQRCMLTSAWRAILSAVNSLPGALALSLTYLDFAVIIAAFLVVLAVGFWVAKRSGESSEQFFLSGRSMPWWLLGVSMVATTFAADTPLLVTDIVRKDGVAGNWVWWAFCLTGMLTVFVYAKLWRRSEVLTDIEFYELRYSGRPASFLRGFRALYLGLAFNILTMTAVNLAAIKICQVTMGLNPVFTIILAATVTTVFSAVGGFRGVVITDMLLFILAMVGALAAAYFAVSQPEVGGIAGLLSNPALADKLNFIPQNTDSQTDLLVTLFILPLAVQWWSAWYPGAEPGGGGYVAQRMLAAKNEKHAVAATLFFNVAHYAVRPWPWIIVALASLVIFPMDSPADAQPAQQVLSQSDDAALAQMNPDQLQALKFKASGLTSLREAFPEVEVGRIGHDMAYPAMLRFVPSPWLGIIIASLLAAYVSTISTHLNWGSSYIVNDFFVRFIQPDASESSKVWVGRLSTVIMMVASMLLALQAQSAKQIFDVIIMFGAGTGLLFLLRWFWWRINAWSELTAMVVSGVLALTFQFVLSDWFSGDRGLPSWSAMPIQVALTTAAWILVSVVTPPADDATLAKFYKLIQPGTFGWNGFLVRAKAQGIDLVSDASHSGNAGNQVAYGMLAATGGCLLVYGALFATGFFIYGDQTPAIICVSAATVGVGIIVFSWRQVFVR